MFVSGHLHHPGPGNYGIVLCRGGTLATEVARRTKVTRKDLGEGPVSSGRTSFGPGRSVARGPPNTRAPRDSRSPRRNTNHPTVRGRDSLRTLGHDPLSAIPTTPTAPTGKSDRPYRVALTPPGVTPGTLVPPQAIVPQETRKTVLVHLRHYLKTRRKRRVVDGEETTGPLPHKEV